MQTLDVNIPPWGMLWNTPGMVSWAQGLSEGSGTPGQHSDMGCAMAAAGAAMSSPAEPQDAAVRWQKGLESLLLRGMAGTHLGRELLLAMSTDETHEGNNNPALKCVGSGDTGLTLSLL